MLLNGIADKSFLKVGRLNLTPAVKTSIGIITGFFICLVVVYLAHFHLVPNPSRSDSKLFNPVQTCQEPPIGCWDAYSKEHYKCITYDKDTILRTGVVIKKGERSCYKSIYFNLDSTSFYMIAWLFLWATVTSRAAEGVVLALLNDNLRQSIALALLISLPSVWYVCSLMIHYLNDRYFPYYYSQLFFTLSELSCQIIAILHISKKDPVYNNALVYLGGTCMAHILQLAMDEPWIVTGNAGTSFRNIAFLLGDACLLYSAWTISGQWRRKFVYFAMTCFGQLLIFQLFFADAASFAIIDNIVGSHVVTS